MVYEDGDEQWENLEAEHWVALESASSGAFGESSLSNQSRCDEAMEKIVKLGFSAQEAHIALQSAEGIFERAIEILLD